jgi:hypothetical protein
MQGRGRCIRAHCSVLVGLVSCVLQEMEMMAAPWLCLLGTSVTWPNRHAQLSPAPHFGVKWAVSITTSSAAVLAVANLNTACRGHQACARLMLLLGWAGARPDVARLDVLRHRRRVHLSRLGLVLHTAHDRGTYILYWLRPPGPS